MSKEKLAVLRAKGYDFDIQNLFERAWGMYRIQPLLNASFTMLIISANLLAALYLKDYAFLYSLFLAPHLFSGFYFVANKFSQGQQVVYPDFFKGLSFYIPIFSVWLIGQMITALGFVALVIPGVYFLVAYNFAVLMVIFGGFDFWTALEESRKLITVRWGKFAVLVIILIVINILGALLFLFGLIVTLPISYYVTYILFEDLTEDVFAEEGSGQSSYSSGS
ncbi:hypothetical protein A33Q_3216 [Indibacter alkaliphilus LW1]|uniref:DUF975 family protein n=1 Tax=Indibacter alkaliphilus (strain CCUG 57479 / KCTC 22604 / LW1) TaxID=1189612 RepID=S2DAA2_INDAL|nr:hypothetical protein [Indibacter alkaliphilus]EOZ95854.1 hypothetical protein A33Q_3216 [Indibacter alkaliphilus LW1]